MRVTSAQCQGRHGDDQPADRRRGLSRAVRRPARLLLWRPRAGLLGGGLLHPDQDGLFLLVRFAASQYGKGRLRPPFSFGGRGARLVSIKNTGRGSCAHVLLASALVLTPGAAFADLAVSGKDGKQVRAGDGLPMVPTPDSVAVDRLFQQRRAQGDRHDGGLRAPSWGRPGHGGGARLQLRAGDLPAEDRRRRQERRRQSP